MVVLIMEDVIKEHHRQSLHNHTIQIVQHITIARYPNQGENIFNIHYNYCIKMYKFQRSGEYSTLMQHVKNSNLDMVGITTSQTQLHGFRDHLPLSV